MFNWIFDTSAFFTRDACGHGWTGSLTWGWCLGNAMIFLAYMLIPILILAARSWSQSKNGVFGLIPKWAFIAFAAFILSCGIGHLWDITVFWWAPYHFYTIWHILTGIISLATAWGLFVAIKKVCLKWSILQEEKKVLEEKMATIMEIQKLLEEQIQKAAKNDSSNK